MKYILETERLYLREFELSDAESFFQLNSDPEVIKYTGDPPFSSIESALDFIKSYDQYQKNGFGRWAVIKKENNEFIGFCGLKKHDENFVDIGFRFFRKDWNHGYASESALPTLKYGFEELHLKEIIGRSAKENKASIKVLKKLGMEFWKEDECDGIEDSVYYRISNEVFMIHPK